MSDRARDDEPTRKSGTGGSGDSGDGDSPWDRRPSPKPRRPARWQDFVPGAAYDETEPEPERPSRPEPKTGPRDEEKAPRADRLAAAPKKPKEEPRRKRRFDEPLPPLPEPPPPEPRELAGPPEPPEPAEAPKPVEAPKPPESAKPAETPKPPEPPPTPRPPASARPDPVPSPRERPAPAPVPRRGERPRRSEPDEREQKLFRESAGSIRRPRLTPDPAPRAASPRRKPEYPATKPPLPQAESGTATGAKTPEPARPPLPLAAASGSGTAVPSAPRRSLRERLRSINRTQAGGIAVLALVVLGFVLLDVLSSGPEQGLAGSDGEGVAKAGAKLRDAGGTAVPGGQDLERPNIITIVTDDQDDLLFTPELMPNVFSLLDEGATRLDNFTIVTPLCCPSRATQLTGQYGHNNGVLANDPGYSALKDANNVLPNWLRRAGYQTAQVGRYLNGYRAANGDPSNPAPGWDRWIGLINLHYREYDLSYDGIELYRGEGKGSYVTRKLGSESRKLVKTLSQDDRPYYLQIDHLAPHSDSKAEGPCVNGALPGPRGLEPVLDLKLPDNPALEKDVSDKPQYIQNLPPIDQAARDAVQRRYRCRAASIEEADDQIGKLISALKDTGQWDETVIIFYSDNGYFSGQHRVLKSKGLPYEEAIQVPAVIRIPEQYLGVQARERTQITAANIDIVPTILQLADAAPCLRANRCRTPDGRSLLPALADPESWPRERTLLIEVDQKRSLAGGTLACEWKGVRRAGQVYVEYQRVAVGDGSRVCIETDEAEHYRLASDPEQRRNLWPPSNPSDERAQEALAVAMGRLADCKGNDAAFSAPPPATPCE